MASRTVAESIALHLVKAGVERLYGLPGGEMLDLLEASRKAGIEFVLVHHEAAAAFMAAAEGQYRRSPGACISTLGPGATNLVTGIAHAYLDRSPVIALTAQLPTTLGSDYTHQRLALEGLFTPITKGSFVVEAATAEATIETAIDLACTEPFGPVSLHIPRNVMLEPAGATTIDAPIASELLDGDLSIDDLASRLNQAERPLVVVGLGAPPSASETVGQFVDVYGAPVGVTPKVKGLISAQHPLFAGTYGGMMAESVLFDFARERDLILGIGLDPTELDRDWPAKERIVWMLPSLNVSQTALPRSTWIGDIQTGLQGLLDRLKPRLSDGREDAARMHRAVRTKLESAVPQPTAGLSPLGVLDALAKVWPASDPVCCDVGAHKLLIGQQWPSSVPNRFFISNGLSAMGFGIAAPIALSLAAEKAPVLAVIGDGGLTMYLGELETAVRLRAHVLYVVFCDASLALIESAQRRRRYPLYGMRFEVPNFVEIGRAFGMPTWHITSEEELFAAVSTFRNGDGPALVSVPIDPREYDQQAS